MLSYLKSLVVFASGVALAACSGAAGTPSNDADSGIPVVASTNVYGDIAEVIGGDLVRVTSIIDNPSADPEEYEATPRDAAAVAEADLVIVNGGGYDPFLMPLIETAGGEREVLVVTDVSGLQPTDPAETEFNEHVWFSLPAMTELADRIAETLSGISSPDAETFVANAAAFKADLEPLQARVASIKSEHGGAQVAATEPLPLYLLADAGLDNVTPEAFIEASEEGSDAPAAVVQQALELLDGGAVKALLLNTQTQTPATDRMQQAADDAGVAVLEVNETLPDGSNGYVDWMGEQIDGLATALDQSR